MAVEKQLTDWAWNRSQMGTKFNIQVSFDKPHLFIVDILGFVCDPSLNV